MMNKNFNILALLLLLALSSNAQQVSQNNFYVQNPFSINPAATGIQGNLAGNLNFRDQWTGLKGAPEVSTIGLHSLVSPSMGLGVNIEQTESGVFKQFTTELNYSYRLLISEGQSVAFGLKSGFSQNTLNYQIMEVAQESDPALYSSSQAVNEMQIRAGTGVHYNRKDLNVHFSVPLLYGQQEKKYFQTMYGFASYDIFAAEKIWKFQPSALYRYTKTGKAQVDVNLMAEWDKKVWALLGYRTNQNLLTGFGLFFKGLGLGYSYEINRNNLSNVSSGSHEIMIYFETGFSFAKNEPHYRSSKRNLDRD